MDKESLLPFDGKVPRYRKTSLSDSEIVTILIGFCSDLSATSSTTTYFPSGQT